MTMYAGETIWITSQPFDFDAKRALTNEDLSSVKAYVYDSSKTLVLDGVDLAWDPEQGFWLYLWKTDGQSAGSYKAKIVITSALDNTEINWDWKTFRLNRDKVTA